MSTRKSPRGSLCSLAFALLFSPFATALPPAPAGAATFTILHTNDFHGQLELSGSNPGASRVAAVVNTVRDAVGAQNVLLLDAGDQMQGSLLSNLNHGAPTVGTFNAMGYDAATVGNHEFDWGQAVLADRVAEATHPYVSANVVVDDTGSCATAGWTSPAFVDAPYRVLTVGTAPDTVKVGVIGVTTPETPYVALASATAGLCFKDPADAIVHHYDAMRAEGAQVVVVLSHLGHADGGYGYGIPVYGDQTLATKLTAAGKPADLIIGGHSHTDLASPTTVGATKVVQAHYSGRKVGRADVTVGGDGSVLVAWTRLAVSTTGAEDAAVKALVNGYAADPAYQALVSEPVGYVQTDLARDYNGNSMMADFVDDAVYGALNTDAEPLNDVDFVLNNPGGIRVDWCDKEDLPDNPGTYVWSGTGTDCSAGGGVWTHAPMALTYGQTFSILPFGNQTIVGSMTGAQVLELLHQSATLFKGALQPAGLRYRFFRYADALPGPQPYAWGACDVEVFDRATSSWVPLEPAKTYRVGTNEFLAPAGQDGFTPFKYLRDITYWGDMLDAVNAYVGATYTVDNPYRGPNGDGLLDGRIARDGDGDDVYDAGEIVPLTVLHHNDSHGNLDKSGIYPGYTQLATLIRQERLHNPERTLLLSAGDNLQGDAMLYLYRTAWTGFTADGTAIVDPAMWISPFVKAFNAMGYDAVTLGNHEYNFGRQVFAGALAQATFPLLQANVAEDAADPYGLATANVQPYVLKTVGPEAIDVAILGIGNHRVPSYELPTNIPGLTFSNPLTKAQELSTALRASNDVLIALTHIGFTANPGSVELDTNVDTNLAAQVAGLDAVVGGHSHTDPSKSAGAYKYLPVIVAAPDGRPVAVAQAYRYNNTLGELSLGLRGDGAGGYDVVSQTGRSLSVPAASTPEDAEIDAIVAPYTAGLAAYSATVVGATTVPLDSLQAYTQETNAANLQADASVFELETLRGIPVDFHLSGAMANQAVAASATPATPFTLKVSDLFQLMPYENSLVVLQLNGPQLKALLERSYRNYYYYKYVPGYGGYSRYTTCMLDTDAGNEIVYDDRYPSLPDGDNVSALKLHGTPVDFADAGTFYRVSTVNYLAAGSCNFSDAGVTLWPLDQVVADTQHYVRDAVVHYVQAQGTVAPAVEGRIKYAPEPEIRVLDAAADIPAGTGAVDFGATPVGVPVDRTFTVRNVGQADLALTTPSLPAGFSLAADFGSAVVAPGGETIFVVRMDAAAVGAPSGTVSFATNDSDENPFAFTVGGSAFNAAPVAVADAYVAIGGTTLSGASVLANDTDLNPGDSLSAAKVSDPAHGTLTSFNADGTFSYTPDPGFSGTDSFTYTADDGLSISNAATVTISVRVRAVFTSSAAQDGWVLESTPTSGAGGAVNAAEAFVRLGDDAANRQYRSVLSFPTAGLPDGAIIHSAVLRVRKYGTAIGTNPYGRFGKLLVDVRKGAFGAGPALTVADFAAPASGARVASFGAPAGGWYEATLGAAGRAQVNATGVTQFRLYFAVGDDRDGAADTLRVASGNGVVAARPQLVILYSLPDTR